MGLTVGIDLGTTNSCLAYLDDQKASIVDNEQGDRTTPSIVAIDENGDRLVGGQARRQAQINPAHTAYMVKRLMGRRFDDEALKQVRHRVSYPIRRGPDDRPRVVLRGNEYSPSQLSSLILRKLKADAEKRLGESIENAVITVPAYFNDAQRQATENAGRIAGLSVLRIVNEPTAAALAYGYGLANKSTSGQRIAVYDLGGGTFDISLLELSDGVLRVVATAGDTFLGGNDFDHRVVDWLAHQFEAEHGVDLREDEMASLRLREEAERAKCRLSSEKQTQITLPFIYSDDEGPKNLDTELSRHKLEALVSQLVERTLSPCQRALDDAEWNREDIDEVLMVGGMTRMPLVQRRLREFFDTELQHEMNPDEVVAKGAAIQGGIATGELADILLLDVTPLTLGIETEGGVFTPLISRNTTIPCRETEVFSTTRDNQQMVKVHVLQGERSMAKDNQSLAVFELSGIPEARRGEPAIEVTFEIDENGMVTVTARDRETGEQQTVEVVAEAGLSEAEVRDLIEAAEQNQQRDLERRQEVQLRNRARQLLSSTKQLFEKHRQSLSSEKRRQMGQNLQMMSQIVDGAEGDSLRAMMGTLQGFVDELARDDEESKTDEN